VPRTRIERLAREETPVTADTALRLARYLGTSAAFWMAMQAQSDLECAEDRVGAELRRIEPMHRPNDAETCPSLTGVATSGMDWLRNPPRRRCNDQLVRIRFGKFQGPQMPPKNAEGYYNRGQPQHGDITLLGQGDHANSSVWSDWSVARVSTRTDRFAFTSRSR
jgi:hypothetical protein